MVNPYPGLTSWAILSRPCGTDRDKPGELICFQRVRYESGASLRDRIAVDSLTRSTSDLPIHQQQRCMEAQTPTLSSREAVTFLIFL